MNIGKSLLLSPLVGFGVAALVVRSKGPNS